MWQHLSDHSICSDFTLVFLWLQLGHERCIGRNAIVYCDFFDLILFLVMLADFDAIYEEETENEENIEDTHVAMVPDPIVVRGAGNMTVYELFQFFVLYFHF